jgi:hypothetical protein
MSADYRELYSSYIDYMSVFLEDDKFFNEFVRVVKDSKNEFSLTKKQCVKTLEMDWIETIENCIPSLDKVIRNPRKFIETREEILPIEISRNITAESIKHLSQHTNLIRSIEGDKITPSKILNVFKEESMDTYENRFVNTLLNRLLIFVTKRFDKLKSAMSQEDYLCLKMEQEINMNEQEKVDFSFEMKSYTKSNDGENGKISEFSRVLKIKQVVMEFSSSPFANEMKKFAFIRPPIMRTNAIMKDTDLKNCLNLWLFIESYDKIGYSIDYIDVSQKPNEKYINELYGISAINYALFKYYTSNDQSDFIFRKVRKKKALVPVYIKEIYDEFTTEFNVTEVEFRKIMNVSKISLKKKRSEQENLIKNAISTALKLDKKYKKQLEIEEMKIEKEKLKNKVKRK